MAANLDYSRYLSAPTSLGDYARDLSYRIAMAQAMALEDQAIAFMRDTGLQPDQIMIVYPQSGDPFIAAREVA